MPTLNLGILAHVDAGKTSLTERLLFAAGAIETIGSVDQGSTHTDTLAQERQRGITIKSAVAAFVVGDVAINLIDTPGHPDFIAEVERVLNALDGAVLVISAVEGVQAQTRVLMRTLHRLHIPFLIFVNKIDRRGARHNALLQSIAEKLTPAIVGMGAIARLGTPDADFVPYGQDDGEFRERLAERLADGSDTILADYLEGGVAIPYRRLRDELAAQSRRGLVHPVFFGSAITGAGIETLLAGIVELLPSATGDARASASGTVFKIERGISGEKIAYARMFCGTLRARDRLQLHGREQKVTAISVFDRGAAHPRPSVVAGQIAKLRGLEDVRIGDAIGAAPSVAAHRHFAPPTLETIIVARRTGDRRALHAALVQLAEQDPLINLRQDGILQELSVSLYGEVQKEVLQETLAADFGIEVEFRGTTTICIERPIGTGTALLTAPDPFVATIGLRLEPAPAGSGVEFRLEVESGFLPASFFKAVEDATRATLRQGLRGWEVNDCRVTMTHAIRIRDWGPLTTAAEHRNLTPLVVMGALQQAGTQVCEPIHRFHLEAPADTLGSLLSALAFLHASAEAPQTRGASCLIEGEIPAAHVHDLRRRLPSLTRGEGLLDAVFDRYEPVRGPVPMRPRLGNDPLNRKDYLLRVVSQRRP